MDAIPEGFELLERQSPFTAPIGPIYQKAGSGELSLALRVAEQHTNARGLVHGGLIATLADLAMGYAMGTVEAAPKSGVTTSLTTDLFGAANIGDWLEVRAEAKRVGGKLAFCSCDVFAEGARIAQGTAVYRVTR